MMMMILELENCDLLQGRASAMILSCSPLLASRSRYVVDIDSRQSQVRGNNSQTLPQTDHRVFEQ